MHLYVLFALAQVVLYSHVATAVEFGQLAVGWCLNHPEAQAGYAQCISKVVCKSSGQTGQPASDSAACVSYGECDCSRIEDKDCDEYSQCISNPKCAACTAPETTPAPSTSTVYGTETLTPGTYTFTSSGSVLAAVVPSPTATITDFSTITNSMTMTATSTLTMTITRYPTTSTTPTATTTDVTTITDSSTKMKTSKVTVTSTRSHTLISTIWPTSTTTSTPVQTPTYKTMTSMLSTTRSTTPTQTSPPTCPSYCDCEPKYGDPDAYESCLRQPECAGCGIPFPPLPEPVPESTTFWQNSTITASAKPTPSCAVSCDCSKIEDKASNIYFQCITNPDCERCLVGGRRSGKRTNTK